MIDFATIAAAVPLPYPFNVLILAMCLVALVIGAVLDIKTREIPDWVSYGLIIFGLGFHLIYALVTWDWMFMLSGLAGFLAFVAIGYLMYYAGQWGGGDAKLLMGLGAMLGLELSFQKPPFLLVFIVYTLLIGSFYGMVWSVVMAVKHRKKFYAELKRSLANPATRRLRMALLGFGAAMIIWSLFVHDYFLKMLILSLFIFVFLFFYLWVFVKAVEKVCMLKRVQPEQLTEGDWIAKDVFVGGKYITGPKDLGIEKKSIAKLIALKKKGKVRKILIKVGIPFVPSFLIAFMLAVLFSRAFASIWVLLG